MPENTIKVGDVVALKSGSEKMTVESLDGDSCSCCWIDKNGSKREAKFHVDTVSADLNKYAYFHGGCISAGKSREK